MAASKNEELLKRIARLVKQNQELEENIRKLEKLYEKLAGENERLKALSGMVSPELLKDVKEGEKKERSLKFNMATVLFAEIRGFSKPGTRLTSQMAPWQFLAAQRFGGAGSGDRDDCRLRAVLGFQRGDVYLLDCRHKPGPIRRSG